MLNGSWLPQASKKAKSLLVFVRGGLRLFNFLHAKENFHRIPACRFVHLSISFEKAAFYVLIKNLLQLSSIPLPVACKYCNAGNLHAYNCNSHNTISPISKANPKLRKVPINTYSVCFLALKTASGFVLSFGGSGLSINRKIDFAATRNPMAVYCWMNTSVMMMVLSRKPIHMPAFFRPTSFFSRSVAHLSVKNRMM